MLNKNIHKLAKQLVEKLTVQKLTITTAESCTGGLLATAITEISGSSTVFGTGYVTYANEAKTKLLGVKSETLKKYGAVSQQTAKQMAEGAFKKTGADIAISVTGIAGPTGGTAKKPVGLVFIGIKLNTKAKKKLSLKDNVLEFNLSGSRSSIRGQVVEEILNILTQN